MYIKKWILATFLSGIFLPYAIEAATILVTTNADSGAGSFREALTAPGSGDIIQFNASIGTITLSSPLPQISTNLTINTASGTQVIDGAASFRGLLITAGTVSVSSVNFQNCTDIAGAGGAAMAPGGGGMGAGGGIYVGGTAAVTISDVAFSTCGATGGAGGAASSVTLTTAGGGGGGGLGGAGGASSSVVVKVNPLQERLLKNHQASERLEHQIQNQTLQSVKHAFK